jgi:glycosyltransferase involved in cell wall biosynthesis
MPSIVHKLREWDFVAAQRSDFIISNSENTRARVKKYYDREATVIYPGIETSKFIFSSEKEDFYLYVGRVIPYKKFDLIVDAFNEN